MAQDIEEFLRMAAARKKQQAQQRQAPEEAPQQRPAQPPQRPAAPMPSQQRAAQSKQSDQDVFFVSEADTVETQVPNLRSSIRPTVSSADIADHASHLGEQVHQRHDDVEDRVQKKFDHELGRLQKEDIDEPGVVDHGRGVEHSADVMTVLGLIRNPKSLQNAIILKEIFDRPKY